MNTGSQLPGYDTTVARTEILTETGLSQKELYRRTGQCSGRDADRVPSDTLRGLHFPSFYSAMHGATLLFSLGANSPGSCWHDGCKKEEKRVEGPQLGHEHLSQLHQPPHRQELW